MKKRISEEQKRKIVEDYLTGNFSCAEVGRRNNCSAPSVTGILKSKNIEICTDLSKICRKYKVNEDYFDKIDNEEKAYFLGFLYADGCNYTPKHHIHLPLQEEDKEILEKFLILLESDYKLLFINTNKKSPNRKNLWRLNICSKKISQRLTELGCVHQKALKLEFPTENQVPNELIKHFIRGYYDGDGGSTVYLNKKTEYYKYCASITSSTIFCEHLKNLLIKEIGLNTYVQNAKNKKTSNLKISGRNQVEKFLSWIYDSSNIKLKRKYDKYLKDKDFFKNLSKKKRGRKRAKE